MSATRILPLFLLLTFCLPLRGVLQAQVNQLILPNGHENGVSSIQFTKDGKKLMSTSFDQTIRIWDFASGSLLRTIYTGETSLGALALSPDEKYAVTITDKKSLKVWDTKTWKSVIVLNGHQGSILGATFSPDGKNILTASTDNTAIIWSMPDGKLLFRLIGHKKDVDHACFSPDGQLIATCSTYDSTTRIWNAADGRFLFELPGKLGSRVFSNDSKRLLTSYLKNGYEWSLVDGKKIHEYKEDGIINTISYNSTSAKVLIYTYPRSCIVRDVKTGAVETKLEGDSSFMYPSFSPDDRIIITYDSNKDILLWDARTGKPLPAQKKLHQRMVYSVDFSPDNRYIASASSDSSIIIRETSTGKLIHKLETKVESILDFNIDNTGRNLASSVNGKAYLWDLRSGQNVAEMKDRAARLSAMEFSHDGKELYAVSTGIMFCYDIATGMLKSWKWLLPTGQRPRLPGQKILAPPYGPVSISADKTEVIATLLGTGSSKNPNLSFQPGRVLIWNQETGDQVYEYKDNKSILCANLSPDGKKIVIGFDDSTLLLIDRETGSRLATFDQRARIRSVSISKDGNRIIILAGSGVTIWNTVANNYFDLIGHNAYINSVAESPDGSKILTASEDQTAHIWDANTGRLLMMVGDNSGAIRKAVFADQGKTIVTQTATNLFIAWNTHTGKKLYSFYPGSPLYNFIQISSGYYQSSREYSRLLHYVTTDLKVLSFEQLDVKYNRPDKVLEAIGNTDTALIKSYRRAWEKRIKKLGIDTTQFRDGYSVPECDFADRDKIEYEQKNGKLSLRIKGNDSTYKLDRFNVWVNESPLFGQRGIRIRKKSSNSIDTTITIVFSQGENRIETSITNVNGTESYRMPLYVNYIPAVKQKEMIRFIGIGIDQFKESNYNLQYSSKDIRDLAVKLKEKYKDNIIIDTLFNENVTTEKVKALKQKLQQTTVNDKVIISYSGHGLLSKDYDYYLSTYSVNFSKPEENGLPYDELESLLDSIPARKKLLLIDACHSGEVDKEEGIAMNKTADSLGLSKGIIIDQPQQQHVGLKNSFELMQSLFVNVGKSTGATIISAAAGNQFALERGDLKNGVFTYSILEAMNNNPTIKISELKKIVGERVEQLTNGLQKPTSRNENMAVDWSLW